MFHCSIDKPFPGRPKKNAVLTRRLYAQSSVVYFTQLYARRKQIGEFEQMTDFEWRWTKKMASKISKYSNSHVITFLLLSE